MLIKWNVTIPRLSGDTPRRTYVWLPDDYEDDPEKRYPVLYMFDGHNVFFDEDATYGKSWGMADFAEYNDLPVIVAAVESHRGANGERLSEYSPFTVRESGLGGYVVGRGRTTMEWLVNEFKPLIDADEYRRFVANDFVQRVYVGNRLGLISNLIESDDLSAEDIAELKKIIEEK